MSGGVQDEDNNDANDNNDLQKYFSNGEGERHEHKGWEEEDEGHSGRPMSMDEFGSPAKEEPRLVD